MRNPERISVILDEIRKYWERNPDLRLGQIISNFGQKEGLSEPFYLEDDKLLKLLAEANSEATHKSCPFLDNAK